MFSFVGYNFIGDLNALDPAPTSLDNIRGTQIQNGIFDHINMTRDVAMPYSTEIPTAWDYLTVFDSSLNGTIDAGNIDFVADQISKIRVKRRVKGTFEWITLYEIPINSVEDLSFVRRDNLNRWGVEYEYALAPVMNENDELNYITNTILSDFSGVFICDMETIFKFYSGVSFSGFARTNRTSVFEPLGGKYPIVVSNAITQYESGSLKGNVILEEDLYNNKLSRLEEVEHRNLLMDFVVNKKAKILKDWNGNIWLMVVVNSPQIEFFNSLGMGLSSVSMDIVQLGDANSADDLYESGVTDIQPRSSGGGS